MINPILLSQTSAFPPLVKPSAPADVDPKQWHAHWEEGLKLLMANHMQKRAFKALPAEIKETLIQFEAGLWQAQGGALKILTLQFHYCTSQQTHNGATMLERSSLSSLQYLKHLLSMEPKTAEDKNILKAFPQLIFALQSDYFFPEEISKDLIFFIKNFTYTLDYAISGLFKSTALIYSETKAAILQNDPQRIQNLLSAFHKKHPLLISTLMSSSVYEKLDQKEYSPILWTALFSQNSEVFKITLSFCASINNDFLEKQLLTTQPSSDGTFLTVADQAACLIPSNMNIILNICSSNTALFEKIFFADLQDRHTSPFIASLAAGKMSVVQMLIGFCSKPEYIEKLIQSLQAFKDNANQSFLTLAKEKLESDYMSVSDKSLLRQILKPLAAKMAHLTSNNEIKAFCDTVLEAPNPAQKRARYA